MDAFTAIPDSVRTAIDSTREVMLATVDTTQLFWFSNDVEFQSANSHAYWLMNRMMHTVQNVRTAEDGIAWALALNENAKDWNLKRSEYAYNRLDGCFDFNRISEMAHLYEEAYRNWLEAREEIATYLPKEQGKSYRDATNQMHARLYDDLRELKDIKY